MGTTVQETIYIVKEGLSKEDYRRLRTALEPAGFSFAGRETLFYKSQHCGRLAFIDHPAFSTYNGLCIDCALLDSEAVGDVERILSRFRIAVQRLQRLPAGNYAGEF